MYLLYGPAILLFGICATDSVPYSINTCSAMVITTHSARKQERPKCPSMDGKIMKAWYICTMEFYSTVQKNKIMKLVGK